MPGILASEEHRQGVRYYPLWCWMSLECAQLLKRSSDILKAKTEIESSPL